MPVVSNTVRTTINLDGSADTFLQLYDQDGVAVHEGGFHTYPGSVEDVNERINNRIASITAETDIWLAEQEFEQIIGEG